MGGSTAQFVERIVRLRRVIPVVVDKATAALCLCKQFLNDFLASAILNSNHILVLCTWILPMPEDVPVGG